MSGINYATIDDLVVRLAERELTTVELVESFVQSIDADDGHFNSVAFLNPEAKNIAKNLDKERANGIVRGPLHGVPILLKDNIDTSDSMMTSAGSLALEGAIASKDSQVAARLRASGAVLLGKTNLSEWANFRSTRSSSGWSSRGGQVRNAYAIDRTPGGSSSGSGVATARGFCAGAIGTETDGSIVGPSSMNSLVGIKPTVGMVSRSGIIPISHSQDTAGPMARTVTDATIILSAISGVDPFDVATIAPKGKQSQNSYEHLNSGALKGKKIGVIRNYAGFHEGVDCVFEKALSGLEDAGAELVDGISLVAQSEIRLFEVLVMRTEFKVGLNKYLLGSNNSANVKSLSDLITFNEENKNLVMPYFQQEQLIAAEETNGLHDPLYQAALKKIRQLTREEGIDHAILSNDVCALVTPTSPVPWSIDLVNGDNRLGGSSCLAAISGYPSITVPMGYVSGLPVGLSFIGKAWEDYFLINLAYAFEQATCARINPDRPARFLS